MKHEANMNSEAEAVNYLKVGGLEVAEGLYNFIKDEAAPGTGVVAEDFWRALAGILEALGPRNEALLRARAALQQKIDAWHIERRQRGHDPVAYKTFLQDIGYLVEPPEDIQIKTTNVDDEIASVPGPQLVVPLDNARYVLNAVNARWGSLYDAFYSTDTISEANGCRRIKKYNPIRGDRVIERARHFLDRHFALERDTHKHVTRYFMVLRKIV